MIEVVVGTNRKDSNSQKVAEYILNLLKKNKAEAQILNLDSVDWSELNTNLYGEDNRPSSMSPLIDRINESEGLYMIVPEYNGSYPGVIKTFIDHWSYPKSFEKRPVCFVGLGGLFGGLRPVEHLQHVFGYRNAFIYPERVFLRNVWSILDEKGDVTDKVTADLLETQAANFVKYVNSLKGTGLHCIDL